MQCSFFGMISPRGAYKVHLIMQTRGTEIIRVKAEMSSDGSQMHKCDQANKLSRQCGQMTCFSTLLFIFTDFESRFKHLKEYFPCLSSRENYKLNCSPRTERVMTALGPVV